ncbi:MAG: hypothetical protein S4CHLAM102_08360 [Chlamydiia bacterium]|nr:hypothetical protein [Chlamydiia bacterium]
MADREEKNRRNWLILWFIFSLASITSILTYEQPSLLSYFAAGTTCILQLLVFQMSYRKRGVGLLTILNFFYLALIPTIFIDAILYFSSPKMGSIGATSTILTSGLRPFMLVVSYKLLSINQKFQAQEQEKSGSILTPSEKALRCYYLFSLIFSLVIGFFMGLFGLVLDFKSNLFGTTCILILYCGTCILYYNCSYKSPGTKLLTFSLIVSAIFGTFGIAGMVINLWTHQQGSFILDALASLYLLFVISGVYVTATMIKINKKLRKQIPTPQETHGAMAPS